MKKYKRLIGFCLSWILYGAFVWLCSELQPPWNVALFCGVASVLILILLGLVWRVWAMTALLVGSLALLPFDSRAQETPPKNDNVIVYCFAVVVIVAVGVIVVVKVKKLCDGINCQRGDPPEPPPSAQTNAPTQGHHTMPGKKLVADNVEPVIYDVSTNVLANADPDGMPYRRMFNLSISSSTNLLNWKAEGTVDAWFNATWITTLCRDSAGVAVWTNTTRLEFETNGISMPFLSADDPQKFFKVESR